VIYHTNAHFTLTTPAAAAVAAFRGSDSCATMSLFGMIPSSLYSPAGMSSTMLGQQATASFSSSPVVQERSQAAKQFMIPAPAEKKKIELYSPVSGTNKGYSISAIKLLPHHPLDVRLVLNCCSALYHVLASMYDPSAEAYAQSAALISLAHHSCSRL
jgi:hypothetical protein